MYTEITSTANLRVKQARPLLVGAASNESALFAAEGLKLCSQLFDSAFRPLSLWFTAANEPFARGLLARRPCEGVLMSDTVAQRLTDAKSPQGIFALAQRPENADVFSAKRSVVLCGVQDPHNVGTIIRSAAALGFGAAAVCSQSADPFSPKALRGGMGAQFCIPVARIPDSLSALGEYSARGVKLVAAALAENAVSLRALKTPPPLAVVIGNESRGLSDEELKLCSPCIIPMKNGINSLNAAAAATLFMWQLSED